MGLITNFRENRRRARVASSLYLLTVEQSRTPLFYSNYRVPDTVDGRLDMIILHVMLLIRRIREEGQEADAISQEILNLLFSDMDRNLREMGIGDMSIGKHVKRIAKAFYGRAECLETGLDSDSETLINSLMETVFRSVKNARTQSALLATYVQNLDVYIKKQPITAILDGDLKFNVASL